MRTLIICCLLGKLLCLSNLVSAQVAQLTVKNGQLMIDTVYFKFYGKIHTGPIPYFNHAIHLNDTSNYLAIRQQPSTGTVLSFWLYFEDTEARKPILFHHAGENSIEFVLENGLLSIAHYESGTEIPVFISQSKERILPRHWYFINYFSQAESSNLRVLSTDYKFEADFPFSTSDSSELFFGKDIYEKHLDAALVDFQLHPYSKSIRNQLRDQYDQQEIGLYKFHAKAKKEFRLDREQRLLRTVPINDKEFFIDLWDYDELDDDSLILSTLGGLYLLSSQTQGIDYAPNGKVLPLRSKKQRTTLKLRMAEGEINELVFSALSMGYIKSFNTATAQIYTSDQFWDTIHIKPNLESDIKLRFEYEPNALPPGKTKAPILDKSIEEKGTIVSKSQHLLMMVSDFSLPDKDQLKVQLNEERSEIRKLTKATQQIPIMLDQRDNEIVISAQATKLFYCSAQVEIFEVAAGGASKKLFSEKLKIGKKDFIHLPISFIPQQLKSFELTVKDSLLNITILDPQRLDGDSIQVNLDQNVLLAPFELGKTSVDFQVRLDHQHTPTLSFIPISKGTFKNAANLCQVIIKDSRGKILVEYVVQMLSVNEPGTIELIYQE